MYIGTTMKIIIIVFNWLFAIIAGQFVYSKVSEYYENKKHQNDTDEIVAGLIFTDFIQSLVDTGKLSVVNADQLVKYYMEYCSDKFEDSIFKDSKLIEKEN